MNDEAYNNALKNALTEIKNVYNDLNWSFILTQDGTVLSSEDNAADTNITKTVESFQALMEKANAIGGLANMLINGENGKIYASSINDMYLIAGLSKNADLVYFRAMTNAVLPTVMKILDNIASSDLTPPPLTPTPFKPTPIPTPSFSYPPPPKPTPVTPVSHVPNITPTVSEFKIENEEEKEKEADEFKEFRFPTKTEESQEEHPSLGPSKPQTTETESDQTAETVPSQQLIVDRFGGLMVKSDQVQLDEDVLKRWSTLLNGTAINEVEIESFSGKSLKCKVKIITDSKLEGRGLIRIPEKACQSLEVRRGELVRVKPAVPEASDDEEEEEESD